MYYLAHAKAHGKGSAPFIGTVEYYPIRESCSVVYLHFVKTDG